MGKLLLLVAGIVFGYTMGFRDAAAHREDIATRVVAQLRTAFHAQSGTNVDSMMTRLESR
jgi:hypothetical protein